MLLGTNALEQFIAFGLPAAKGGAVARNVAKAQSKIEKLSKAMEVSRAGRTTKTVAKGVARLGAGAGTEAGQESAQFGIQESALGHEIDWNSAEAKESALSGGLMGGIFTGGGMALSGVSSLLGKKDSTTPPVDPEKVTARTAENLPPEINSVARLSRIFDRGFTGRGNQEQSTIV